MLDLAAESFGNLVGRKAPVGKDDFLERFGRAVRAHRALERAREVFEPVALDREARGHGVPAERFDDVGELFRDEIEHVAQVNARNRAARALEAPRIRGCEGDHRPIDALLDARGDEPHDALVEGRVEKRHGRGVLKVDGVERGFCGSLHFALEFAPLRIDFVEASRVAQGLFGVVREETFDPVFHRAEATRRVDARTDRKAEVAHARAQHVFARD